MIRVVILAPTLAVRAGLRTLLTADELLEVVAEASDLSEMDALPHERPNSRYRQRAPFIRCAGHSRVLAAIQLFSLDNVSDFREPAWI